MKIYVIGMGPGNPDLLTGEAQHAIAHSAVIIGDARMTAMIAPQDKTIYTTIHVQEIKNYIRRVQKGPIAILVSGDVGFYSLAALLPSSPGYEVQRICGISSLVYLASKLNIPWQDIYCVSRHGRQASVSAAVHAHEKVFCLTGGTQTVATICQELCRAGLGHVQVTAGENLSYSSEKIQQGNAAELCASPFRDPSVLLIENTVSPSKAYPFYGIPDTAFCRGRVPLTKREIRAVAMSFLMIRPSQAVYDIGCGSGSCTVEAARMTMDGTVYAIDKNPEAMALTKKNVARFSLGNVIMLQGIAPDILAQIPEPPAYAFIGGSGGNIKAILDWLYTANPMCRIVVTAITLETVGAITSYYADRPLYTLEITQLQAARSRAVGRYHIMTGENPVYIFSAVRKEAPYENL